MIPYTPSKKTEEQILQFYRQCNRLTSQQWNIRERLRTVDLAYFRETDLTEEQYKAKVANRLGDADKFQNIVVPLVMPQVEAAVTYQQSVFLSGFPIFGAVAAPEFADAATHMDAIIADEQVNANWVPELLKSMRNGFKYNLGPTEVTWESQKSYALEQADLAPGDPAAADTKQVETTWEGNVIRSLDPYNTFWDTRVSPVDVPKKAEYAGYIELLSRIALKQKVAEMDGTINLKAAFESGIGGSEAGMGLRSAGVGGFYIPDINPESLYKVDKWATTDWMSWAGIHTNDDNRIKYRNMYEVVTIYGRILPADFNMSGVPAPRTPQIWKFVIVNDQVVIQAQRLTNAHNLLPIFFCCPKDDGLSYQTKSFAKDIEPFQQITTALSNSMIAARRRAISDRMIYDPSRISASAIRSDAPVARIPVRPSAFGTPLSESIYQIPFRDEQSQYSMQAIQSFTALANQVSGLNPARQGQFVKGNKTRFEFAETMGYANGRDQTVALTIEGNFFAPLKQVIKTNILQYQGGIELFDRVGNNVVRVDPVSLRKAKLEFKVSDGLLPSDKIIDGESLALFFQTVSQSPQLAQGYNITPLFSYLMKMRGAKIQGFEKSPQQLAYEQAVATWQQTVMQILEMLGQQYGEQLPPMQELQQILPPQPLPEQYGYTPGMVTPSVQHQGSTVMDQYQQAMQGISEANSAQEPTAQGTGAQPS